MSVPFLASWASAVIAAALGWALGYASPFTHSLCHPLWLVVGCGWLGCIGVALLLPSRTIQRPPSQADYEEYGLGPLPDGAPPAQLYLDLMKRIILNLCYHEQSHQVVLSRSLEEGRTAPKLARRFSLRSRVLGEDLSLNTLSMVGLRRLDSLQACISALVAEGIQGDLLEAGCAKGGACIFMRAALRAHDDKERRVFCCDTFAEQSLPPSPVRVALVRPLYILLGYVAAHLPLATQRWLYGKLMRLQQSFPVDVANVTDDTVRSFMFYLTHGHHLHPPSGSCVGGSLDHVRSNFARLGLLDDQVRQEYGILHSLCPMAWP